MKRERPCPDKLSGDLESLEKCITDMLDLGVELRDAMQNTVTNIQGGRSPCWSLEMYDPADDKEPWSDTKIANLMLSLGDEPNNQTDAETIEFEIPYEVGVEIVEKLRPFLSRTDCQSIPLASTKLYGPDSWSDQYEEEK